MLEKVQRRAARYVTGRFRNRSSVDSMIHTLNLPPLAQRRKEARLTMLHKITSGTVAIQKEQYLQPPQRLSRHMHINSYKIPTFRTDYRKYSFFPRTITEWNNVPPEIASAVTLEEFKSQVSSYIATPLR